MDANEKKLAAVAKSLAKNKTFLAKTYKGLLGDSDFSALKGAAAVFMAGSPGAGKTEIAKLILEDFSPAPIRIDADDFRQHFEGYSGTNSHIFQQAATDMVQKMLDRVLHSAKSGVPVPFILDGTFTYARVRDNLKRAIDRGYAVEVYYVYQKPLLAWQFTQAREKKDGRIVPEDVFIRTFIQARANVIEMKRLFGDAINVTVIIKDNDAAGESQVHAYLLLEELEERLPLEYNEDNLRKELQGHHE
jgi:predicted ABC-type ATPase